LRKFVHDIGGWASIAWLAVRFDVFHLSLSTSCDRALVAAVARAALEVSGCFVTGLNLALNFHLKLIAGDLQIVILLHTQPEFREKCRSSVQA
jgi:hypothetical protein